MIHPVHTVKFLCSIQLWIYHLYIHSSHDDLKHFKIKSEITDYQENNEKENISISLANIAI